MLTLLTVIYGDSEPALHRDERAHDDSVTGMLGSGVYSRSRDGSQDALW